MGAADSQVQPYKVELLPSMPDKTAWALFSLEAAVHWHTQKCQDRSVLTGRHPGGPVRAAAAVRGLAVEQSSCGAGAARDLSRPLCDLPLSSPEENHWAAFDCFGRERDPAQIWIFFSESQ